MLLATTISTPSLGYLNLTPLYLGLISCLFLFIALRILLTKRPLLFSSRWMFALMVVAFVPSILMNVVNFRSMHDVLGLYSLASPLMYLVLLVVFWFQMRGYMVLGVTESSLRAALLAAAGQLGYTVEETMSRLRLKETGDELQVSIQGWVGSAQLKPLRRQPAPALRALIVATKTQLHAHPGQLNYFTPVMYLVLGLLMLAMSLGLSTMFHTLRH